MKGEANLESCHFSLPTSPKSCKSRLLCVRACTMQTFGPVCHFL